MPTKTIAKNSKSHHLAIEILCCLLLAACASAPETKTPSPLSNSELLPQANLTVNIPFLSNCTQPDDATLRLKSHEPVTIIVHGCFSSAGRFRSLADVYAFHGQQAICFNYNDRDKLANSSADLITSIRGLSKVLQQPKITVIGHSQGGLVARRALIAEREDHFETDNVDVRLITISAPFGGIKAAAHCGSKPLAWLSLGITKLICQAVTGSKYSEIPPNSEFINKPGNLISSVNKHLKIDTDELGSCRQYNDGDECVEDDYVFSLSEQTQPAIDHETILSSVVVKSGHVEIIGDGKNSPEKLIEILQQQGFLNSTPSENSKELAQLLTHLYHDKFAE